MIFFIRVILIGLITGMFVMKDNNAKNNDTIYKYKMLKTREIKPAGWIFEQLHRDLTKGFIGSYDKINNTVAKNVFVKQNRQSDKQFRIVKEWWNGEHEGYWKDAIIRMAFLTDNKEYQDKAKDWIYDIINNTGKDGYIGIYDDCEESTCRFNHKKGNGELWTTSRILMAMLAYYEFTNDELVLAAAEKATKLVISEYNNRNYFYHSSKTGGVSHGIGFFESLEWLYRITGNTEYLSFAVKLYQDFNNGYVRDDDLKTQNLLDEGRYFRKHGAHIAEGLFVPEFISKLSDAEKYKTAAENTLKKLDYHTTPSGAMRCDEFIKSRKGTADEHYEYCGITEMVSPFNLIFSFTGNFSILDRIELLTYNAGQGARFPELDALSYLTSDNRKHINHREIGKRESYDASHRAAACCTLNGGRLMVYFVNGMWFKSSNNKELLASLYGPNTIKTKINGVDVKIKEKTDYPFSDRVKFEIIPEKTVEFTLTLRKPYHVDSLNVSQIPKAEIKESNDKISITKKWNTNDSFTVDFKFEVEKIKQSSSATVKENGFYLKRGALVYSLPFQHDIDTVKEYNNSGFYRYKITPVDLSNWNLKISEDTEFRFSKSNGNYLYPWDEPVVELNGELINEKSQKVPVTLVPMGNTIFRRVTFSEFKN